MTPLWLLALPQSFILKRNVVMHLKGILLARTAFALPFLLPNLVEAAPASEVSTRDNSVANSYPFHPDQRQPIRLLARQGFAIKGPAIVFVHAWWTNIFEVWLNDDKEPLTSRTYDEESSSQCMSWGPLFFPKVLWNIEPAFQGPLYTGRTMGWVCMSVISQQLSLAAQEERREWEVPIYDLYEIKDNKRIGWVETTLKAPPLQNVPSGEIPSLRLRQKRGPEETPSTDADSLSSNNLIPIFIQTVLIPPRVGIYSYLYLLNQALEELVWPEDPHSPISLRYHKGQIVVLDPMPNGCGIKLSMTEVNQDGVDITFEMVGRALMRVITIFLLNRGDWDGSSSVVHLHERRFKGSFLTILITKKEPGISREKWVQASQ